ncbi:MAG: formylglycine-generating enzyme family protein [Sedimenticola sp.]
MILDPNPPANDFPAPWAVAFGEDAFGRWQAFDIGGERQVMRWIEPGRFLMGSPEDEAERWKDEDRHKVTLTRGYWLADTASTQALWRVVTGVNPAHFMEDPRCPVEQVSWDDCQDFIQTANEHLGGVGPHLRLPSEAEWEHACRAGTKGPFSWGDSLTTEQANYNGNFPYAGGEKGEYRQRTLPALSFEPNPWGLYQMHGNVWEWCADWKGIYPTEPVIDPAGPIEGHSRVLRGGSWYGRGRNLRSAIRDADTPDSRIRSFGLRLAGG